MSEKQKSTMVELVAELEQIKPRTIGIEFMIAEAKAGEYHDYKNQKYDCGKVELVMKLRASGLKELAERVIDGEFDEQADESDQAEMRATLPQNMWGILGL